MAQTFEKGEGGGPNPPYGEDFFQRIVGVHWPKVPIIVAEQALVAIATSSETYAFALDTGEKFTAVNSGASGFLKSSKPWTVLSGGIVVFGQASQADQACFMLCNDGSTIKRGIEGVGGESGIAWDTVYTVSGNLLSLSFAGGIFFVVYTDDVTSPSSCAISIDGENFSEIGSIYPGIPFGDAQLPGSVAFNGSSYATAGGRQVNRSFHISDDCLMWGYSDDGAAWAAGTTPDEYSNPGSNFQLFAAGFFITIGGGMKRFVAAANYRNLFTDPVDGLIDVRTTAAAAVSTDGASWDTLKLPGATEGYFDPTTQSSSQSYSATFIRTSGSNGYFVIAGQGGTSGPDVRTNQSWCWKGDGYSWSIAQMVPDSSMYLVSAIARDLGSTTIVQA